MDLSGYKPLTDKIKRDENGELVTKKISIALNHLEIELLDGYGNVAVPGGETAYCHRFLVRHVSDKPEFNPHYVRSVIMPNLDYSKSHPLMAVVECYVPEE
jgi:hypothetical protein